MKHVFIIIIYKYVHIPTSALCWGINFCIFLIIEQMFEVEKKYKKNQIWFSTEMKNQISFIFAI